MALPAYAGWGERLWYYTFRFICGLIFLFLISPILIVLPLSFNAENYFSFTPGMLGLDPDAFSLRHYRDILTNGMANPDRLTGWWSDAWNNAQWIRSMRNSFFIGFFATVIATVLGTLAAVGLSRSEMPYKKKLMALLISPMIVPLVITGAGIFRGFSDGARLFNRFGAWMAEFGGLFAWIGQKLENFELVYTHLGVILSHAVLGTPFVIITVTATLVGFDQSLVRAAYGMGATPLRTFFKVQMPLILPGVISGALFAFITSFDEVVVVIAMASVEQRTIPRQMFSGIREQISPTILAVATILVVISIALLATLELIRRRGERLRGVTPT